jgi:hypothetical protein
MKAHEQEECRSAEIQRQEQGATARRLAWVEELDEALRQLSPPRTRAEIVTFHLARRKQQVQRPVAAAAALEPAGDQQMQPRGLTRSTPADVLDVLLGQAHPEYWAVLAGAERGAVSYPTLIDYVGGEWGSLGQEYDISASSVVCAGCSENAHRLCRLQ